MFKSVVPISYVNSVSKISKVFAKARRTREHLAKQSVIRVTLLKENAFVCGEFSLRILSFVTKSKIFNMFNIFCHSWRFA